MEENKKPTMMPLCRPTSSPELEQALVEVLRSGWWGYGPKTKELEKRFAEYVGKKYAVAISSGTAALDLCLKVYGIKGGELITTPITFVSDAIVGEWNGMDVTFADVDEDSLCLDPKSVVITPETKAIITVDAYGRLADVKGLREKFKGLIIEDAAHAFWTPGVGQFSDIQIYSFQAVKTLPAGDGGMITTDDEAIYKRLTSLTWLNVEKTIDRVMEGRYAWDYDIKAADGIKAYMNDLNSVVVLKQMDRLEEMNARRRAMQANYNEAFKNIPQIKIPTYSHTVQYYAMKCERRNELSEFLAKNQIHSSVHFKPLNKMTYWAKAEKRPLPVTEKVWPLLLSIPLNDSMSFLDQEKVIKLVKEFYQS